mgnify:CR=1 FL=1
MQIAGIARQLLAPLSSQSSASEEGRTEFAVREPPQGEPSSTGPLREFHEILSRYDMHRITPRELTQLAQELHDAGEIDDAAFRDLATIRLELDRAGQPADQPVNLVELLTQRLAEQRQSWEAVRRDRPDDAAAIGAAGRAHDDTARRLQWIQKFALVRADGPTPLDANA